MNPEAAQQSPFALKKREDKPTTVLGLLQSDNFKSEIAKVLPKHLPAERMLRVALTAVKMNDKLEKVSFQSFASAMLKCSQYGLEPDGRHAHLIPFKNRDGGYDLQLIFGYQGIAALVRRSGEVADIHAGVVFASDDFECSFGTDGKLVHRPNLKASREERGEVVCAYSFVKLKDGSVSYDVMPVWEINDIRDKSQGYSAFKKGWTKSSPWETDWSEMARKTCFRRHSKWLPISAEIQARVNDDDDQSTTMTEDERFKRARSVSAAVVAPDFTTSETTPNATSADSHTADGEVTGESGPSDTQPTAQPAAAATTAAKQPEIPLGESAPRKRATKPEAPATGAPATPTDRKGWLTLIVEKCDAARMLETELMSRVIELQLAPPGTTLLQLQTESLKEIVQDYWEKIVQAR